MGRVAIFFVIFLTLGCSSGSDNGATGSNQDKDQDTFCSHETQNKGSRQIGYEILTSTQTGNFADDLSTTKKMGLSFIPIHFPWNQIETSPGNFEDPSNFLFILNHTANTEGIKLSLILSAIDIPGRYTPSDLSGTKFNQILMANRYKALLDFVFSIIEAKNVISVSVGNEVDAYNFNLYSDTPNEFKSFISNVSGHNIFTTEGVKLAFTATLHGLNKASSTWSPLVTLSELDLIHVTYYPLGNDFKVEAPSVVKDDFAALTNNYSKDILLQEVGYPTSTINNSNERKQAEFFCNFFKEWDSYKNQIHWASILRYNDVTLEQAEATADTYGLTGNQGFVEYIRTLGLVNNTNSGKDTKKEAHTLIENEVQKRGW